MTKREKVYFVVDTLEEAYPLAPIPLAHSDPYTLLIAVLMSAQCTDSRVNQITPLLFERADNPFDMVKLSPEQIGEIIKPVGLYKTKSRGIHGLSKILIDRYNGEVPTRSGVFRTATCRGTQNGICGRFPSLWDTCFSRGYSYT